jgi:N-carbamoylputrescine amidase
MTPLTVALLQMTPHRTDQNANRLKGEDFCRRARGLGADIALFPEMWNIGYTGFCPEATPDTDLWKAPEHWRPDESAGEDDDTLRQARASWQAQAISRDSAFVSHFRALARELDMAIAITYLEQWQPAPRNTVSLLDRHGEIALTYAKVHTCDFDEKEAALTPGDSFPVCALDTAHGPVAVGCMICFDREFPETARLLMLAGAELILVPNACEMERHRIAQFHTRAYENMVGVALANYAAPTANGHSIAFDPIAYDDNGSRETLLVEADDTEGIFLAHFDLDAIRDWRSRETFGNAFRRPHLYTALTEHTVAPPFVRVNAHGERYDPLKRY